MNIEIITAANQSLKETGFGGISSCQNVVDSIQKARHSDRLSLCNSITTLPAIVKRKPDLTILAVKRIPLKNEQDICPSENFTENTIHHSGSSREVLRFNSDKVLTKLYLQNKGIRTARFFMGVNLIPGITYDCSFLSESFRTDPNLSYKQIVSHTVENCLHKKIQNTKNTYLIPEQRIEETLID